MCVHTSRNAVAKQALVKGRQTCTARFWDFFTFQQWCPVNEMIYCWGCPVFDRLQYVKPEGESQVYFITWMTSVLTLVDRGGEGSMIERTSLRPYLVVSAPSAGVLNVHEAKNIPLESRMHAQNAIGIKWTRPSASVFAHCKSSTTGRWEGLGTRLPQNCCCSSVFCRLCDSTHSFLHFHCS